MPYKTREGPTIALSAAQRSVRAVPLSGQALLSSNVHAAVGNIDGKTVPLHLKDGTKFCTRVKNTATDDRWSPWACDKIKA